jgi:hypothetical protein
MWWMEVDCEGDEVDADVELWCGSAGEGEGILDWFEELEADPLGMDTVGTEVGCGLEELGWAAWFGPVGGIDEAGCVE